MGNNTFFVRASVAFTACAGVQLFMAAATAQAADLTSWYTVNSTQIAQVREYSGSSLVTTWPSPGLTDLGGGQDTAAQSDIQQVWSTPNDVFVYSNDLASHVMGPWYATNASPPYGMTNLFGRWPSSTSMLFKLPRNPASAATKQATSGEVGVMVNGVALFNYGDALSYDTSANNESAMTGDKVWNRLAYPVEGPTFDPAQAHQPDNGTYHHHSNPYGIRYLLNDNVSFTAGAAGTLDDYAEDTSNLHHSPILGWAYDGFPIYGPYGYSTANDSNSAIKRMVSGYVLRNGTNGTTENLTLTGRQSIPNWASASQNRLAALPPSLYGPAVGGMRPLGRYAEDYDHVSYYVGSSYSYDLDVYNGRQCVTPEFPGGVYAYFVSIQADGTPVFPNVIGGQFYGTASGGRIQNGTPPGPAVLNFTAVQGVVQDGSVPELNYAISPTKGATDQALGRFTITPNSNGHITHISYTVTLGPATGISNLKLFRTTQPTYTGATQFGSTVASPGASTTFTDTGYTTSAVTHFWLRGDVSAGASGTLNPRLTNVGVQGVNPSSFGGNDPLSNASFLLGSATYTWDGSDSTDYQDPDNWTPTRNTPASDDLLAFTGSATVTNVPTETVGGLSITGTSTVALSASGAATLTVAGSANSLSVPGAAMLTAGSSLRLALGVNQSVGGILSIGNGGTMAPGGYVLSGSGLFHATSGSTLEVQSAVGIVASGASGEIQTSARLFDAGAHYIYNGSAAQVTGNGLPATAASLNINNPTTVTLSQATTATQQLKLTQGALVTNGFGLVVNTDGETAVTRGTGFVSGALTRYFDSSLVDSFRLYPVGTHAYAGVDIVEKNATGTGYITVSTTDGNPPNTVNPPGVLDRYWTVTASGFNPAGAELQLHYLQGDVTGTVNEATMVMARYTGSSWQEVTPDFRDTTNNVIMVENVPGFSIWTAGNSGAVPVTVSGFEIE